MKRLFKGEACRPASYGMVCFFDRILIDRSDEYVVISWSLDSENKGKLIYA
ncbi:MAG: hypothetical protein LBJ00_10090 [Planctomycetaceae bacterium]|nr:hypothetical protein [Planctomycetaceae bacterium]